MNILKIALSAVAALAPISIAAADSHADYLKRVATYKPMAGFNHVVSGERFVGYFLAAPDRCDVTVFQARADDETLSTPPRRFVLQIAAGGRSELEAGPLAALAIACNADANAIKIAPQVRIPRAATL